MTPGDIRKKRAWGMLRELFHRRVPQILGLYIAATWMAIEIGDWVVARFGLPVTLTSYVFVGMVALVPTVLVLAWYHGAPGRDQWTRVEKAFIPANLLVAAFAVIYFVGPMANVEATEIIEVVDETGTVQTFEVPKAGFQRKLSVFFWANQTGDPDLDWLSYGLPVMVSHDLAHETPLVWTATPFESDHLKEEMRNKGFENLLGIPRPLELQLARGRLNTALVSGRIMKSGEGVEVAVDLVDVSSGAILVSLSDSGTDWLDLADRISLGIQLALDIEDAKLGENDRVSDNLTSSIAAARAYVEALRAAELDNDYPRAMADLNQAIAADDSFAEAYRQLSFLQFLSGASQDAVVTIDKALAHDYRLSLASKFTLRASRYQFQQQLGAGIRVLQMWTEVQPENPAAYRYLGQVLMVEGNRQDEAMQVLGRVLELNPAAYDIYMTQALVEQSRGRFDEAAALIREYIAVRPDDSDAYMRLARVYMAAGRHDEARQAYDDAAILATDTLLPELGLANLEIRLGSAKGALARLETLLARELTPTQRVQTLNVVFEAQYVQGRLQATLATLSTMDEEAKAFLPPLLRIIQIGSAVANSQALLGLFDEARASIAEMKAQMQPPFDGYLAFGLLGIEGEAGDEDAYMKALAEAVGFYEATRNEALLPYVLYARAYGERLSGNNDEALTLIRQAVASFEKSFVKTLSDSLVNSEAKVEMARLLIDLDALDDAEQVLLEMVATAPALGSVRQELARLALARGDRVTARRHIEEALKIWQDADPEYTRYTQARTLLDSL